MASSKTDNSVDGRVQFLEHPTIVVNLCSTISNAATEWLIKRISDDKFQNGCQLQVEEVKNNDLHYLYVSASKFRLQLGAEIIGLKKEYKDGSVREFSLSDASNFKNYEGDDFLSESESYRIMKVELDGLRAFDESHIPGHPKVTLYPGKSIFRRMQSNKLVVDLFPLHSRKDLHDLRVRWYKNTELTIHQPLDNVRHYFGDTIGIYFAFLNFYTLGLIPLVMVGIVHWWFSTANITGVRVTDNWMLSIVHVIWAAIFLELWKRKSNEYSYKWGSLGVKAWEEPRTGFRGPLGLNEITQHHEPTFPAWKRYLRIYCFSYPIVLLCISMAVWLMFYYFSWELYLAKEYKNSHGIGGSLLKNFPSIIYSVSILLVNGIYRNLAEWLTDKENHRLETSFQNHLITKILLFDFCNNFLCLFYIAFIYDDMQMLRMTLRNLFLVHMIISQALEALIPYWVYKSRSKAFRLSLAKAAGKTVLANTSSTDHVEKAELSRDDQTSLELQREDYLGTFDDYLELWLQFGYVVLFSCVYPSAGLFALLNNIVEIRSDAFKMCNVYRRPFAMQTAGIGAWQTAFKALSYLAIVSNLALLFHTPSFLSWFHSLYPHASDFTVFALFVSLEHILLFGRWLLSLAVPPIPKWVKVETAKLQYWSLQALKKQRSIKLHPSELLKKTNLLKINPSKTD